MTHRDKLAAVRENAYRPDGSPRMLCAACGSRLVVESEGARCGRDRTHIGLTPALSKGERYLLEKVRAGASLLEVPKGTENRLVYLILQRHRWGNHTYCAALPALGVQLADHRFGWGLPAATRPWERERAEECEGRSSASLW